MAKCGERGRHEIITLGDGTSVVVQCRKQSGTLHHPDPEAERGKAKHLWSISWTFVSALWCHLYASPCTVTSYSTAIRSGALQALRDGEREAHPKPSLHPTSTLCAEGSYRCTPKTVTASETDIICFQGVMSLQEV